MQYSWVFFAIFTNWNDLFEGHCGFKTALLYCGSKPIQHSDGRYFLEVRVGSWCLSFGSTFGRNSICTYMFGQMSWIWTGNFNKIPRIIVTFSWNFSLKKKTFSHLNCLQYQVWREFSQETDRCITSKLRIYHTQSKRYRSVWHIYYSEWNELNTPKSVGHFLGKLWKYLQSNYVWTWLKSFMGDFRDIL